MRYVRNITDVGHLEHDADEGEDKIAKKARLEQLEPMEVAQYYTDRYHQAMDALNVLAAVDRAPRLGTYHRAGSSFVKKILADGFAYESERLGLLRRGEVQPRNTTTASFRDATSTDIVANTRELDGQGEKQTPRTTSPCGRRRTPEHIMRWPSPWSEGFPGWHMECSAMGTQVPRASASTSTAAAWT